MRYFQRRVVAKLGTFGTIRYFFKKSGRKIERLRNPIRYFYKKFGSKIGHLRNPIKYFQKKLVAKSGTCGTL